MADRFKIVVITPSEFVDGEAESIKWLLQTTAADIVHIRKPEATTTQMRRLIESIPQGLHSRLRLHGHFSLLEEFNLGGVHLNMRNGERHYLARSCSRSMHSPGEVAEHAREYDYVTLSPIFDSISKPGYSGEFASWQLAEATRGAGNVVALGGVVPEDFAMLKRLGFAGAALLGYVWQSEDRFRAMRRLRIMRPGRFSLQFVTDGQGVEQTIGQAVAAIENGCNWVQVRMKDAGDADVEAVVRGILPTARRHGAIVLVDDRVDVALRMGADGVHLGKDDMSPKDARAILGNGAIIGATANTEEDIAAYSEDVDYFGVGPLRFTTTKRRLAPTLGYEGYERILAAMPEKHRGTPVVAIGGIRPDDVEPLVAAGVAGVAVSGAIAHAQDAAQAVHDFIDELSKQLYRQNHKCPLKNHKSSLK